MSSAELGWMPLYDPTTDAALNLWLDPSDSSTLLDTGGAAITNGATVGTWNSKAGPARAFTQWGANALPTWNTNSVNGLAACRFQTQLITTRASVAVFNGIPGVTVMRVCRRTTAGTSFDLSCLDPSTGFSDITQWGQSGNSYLMNGWRRPRIDAFDTFTGNSVPATNIFITTSVWDFSAAKADMREGGVQGLVNRAAFGSAGNSACTPYALSVGGFAQQSGLSNGAPSADGYCGELLLWLTPMTGDQCVPAQTYLRLKWGGGLM